MDVDAKKPMREDAIFRIYSMSKGITTAAAMILYDEGKFGLDDPVSKYLPEFKGLKVYGKSGNVAPKREMTVRDLMRHTSGLTYGFFGNHPVDLQYRKAGVSNMNADLVALTGKLGKQPLMYEPGTDWIYSLSVDVLGRLVEVWSGQSFDVFLQDRMFDPLDMKDTGFAVAKSELDRFAQYYTPDGKGKFEVIDEVSNGGKLGNVRILKKKTVKMMIVNQVPDEAMPIAFGGVKRGGVGFGLGFSVRVANSAWDPKGRVGEYGWGGLASTHYWVSPKDDLIVVTMEQTAPFSFLLEWGLKGAIYDAIEKK
jgi:CubicO group peptidase (beta-lactamase class C family)